MFLSPDFSQAVFHILLRMILRSITSTQGLESESELFLIALLPSPFLLSSLQESGKRKIWGWCQISLGQAIIEGDCQYEPKTSFSGFIGVSSPYARSKWNPVSSHAGGRHDFGRTHVFHIGKKGKTLMDDPAIWSWLQQLLFLAAKINPTGWDFQMGAFWVAANREYSASWAKSRILCEPRNWRIWVGRGQNSEQ